MPLRGLLAADLVSAQMRVAVPAEAHAVEPAAAQAAGRVVAALAGPKAVGQRRARRRESATLACSPRATNTSRVASTAPPNVSHESDQFSRWAGVNVGFVNVTLIVVRLARGEVHHAQDVAARSGRGRA